MYTSTSQFLLLSLLFSMSLINTKFHQSSLILPLSLLLSALVFLRFNSIVLVFCQVFYFILRFFSVCGLLCNFPITCKKACFSNFLGERFTLPIPGVCPWFFFFFLLFTIWDTDDKMDFKVAFPCRL